MLTALYIDDEWGEDILLFEEFWKAREWLAQYCADRNEKPEDVCHFIKIILDMRDEKFPERFREPHKFGPDYEWVTTDLAQFEHLAPDMEHLIAAFTRGNEVWLKRGGESLYERVR